MEPETQGRYIPAPHFHRLTPLYDPLLRWGMREHALKTALIEQARISGDGHPSAARRHGVDPGGGLEAVSGSRAAGPVDRPPGESDLQPSWRAVCGRLGPVGQANCLVVGAPLSAAAVGVLAM